METEAPQHPPWYLEPFEGESISHYFGRFRRQEIISVSAPGSLGRAAGYWYCSISLGEVSI